LKGAHFYAGKGASGKNKRKGGEKTDELEPELKRKRDLASSGKPKPAPPAPVPPAPSPAPVPKAASSIVGDTLAPHGNDQHPETGSQDTTPCASLHVSAGDAVIVPTQPTTSPLAATSAGSCTLSSASNASVTVVSPGPAAATPLSVLADVASHDNGKKDTDTAHGSSSSHSLVAPGTGVQLLPILLVPPACANAPTASADAGTPARSEAQTEQLDKLESNVQRLHLDGPAVCSSSTNEVSVGEQPASSAAVTAPVVIPESLTVKTVDVTGQATPHVGYKSTSGDGKLDVDEDMPHADSDAVTSVDDDASRTDSVSTTDEAFSAPTCTCTHFSEHLICSYTVYAYCALLGCGGAMGAVYSLELTPGL
jgi:hypothetical protein